MKSSLNNTSSAGAIIAAAACPICFPKLAAIGAIAGMGAQAPFEVYFFWGMQVLVLLALAGQFVAFKRLQNWPLLLATTTLTALFFLSLYLVVSEQLSYFALAGIILGSLWMLLEDRWQQSR